MSGPDHTIELLRGQSYFDSMLKEIDAARIEIRIETYTLSFDATGTSVLDALARAVERKVDVWLMADGLGSPELTVEHERLVARRGIRIHTYRRPSTLGLFDKLHGRLHRKLAIVDRSVVFIGGLNISDQFANKGPDCFFDLAVRILGPVAQEAAEIAEALFRSAAQRHSLAWPLRRYRWAPKQTGRRDRPITLVVRDNHRNRRAIERDYRAAIRGAHTSILLAHAYFLPSRGLVRELCKAARRGVSIDLMVQGKVEHVLLHWAQVWLYHRLHASGVRIHEYHKRLLHMKVAVVDERWTTIGSSNLDLWSSISNLEANVNLVDRPLARSLHELLSVCQQIDCELFEPRKYNLITRGMAYAANRLMRLIFVTTGGRRNLTG